MYAKTTCVILLSSLLAISCTPLDQSIKKKVPKHVAANLDKLEVPLARGLSFSSVAEARDFIKACNQIRHALVGVDEQVANEVHNLIDDPKVVEVCNVSEETLSPFDILDDDSESENLSPNSMWKVKNFRVLMENEEILGVMFNKLVDQKLSRMSLKILQYALKDTPFFLGENKGWFSRTPITFCDSLEKAQDICAIAKATSSNGKVTGEDFAYLKESIKTDDVRREQVNKACRNVKRNMLLFNYINEYQKADLVHDSDIKRMCEGNSDFNFLYQLKALCDFA